MRRGLPVVLIVVLAAGVAHADDVDQAKAESQKGTGAFGLGDYAEAAQHFEAAFRIKPDDALLYNAAQAFRLAGNKKRALELYRNYVRLYNGRALAQDAKRHIATLEKEVGAESVTPPAPPVAAKPGPVIGPKPAATLSPSVAPSPPAPPANAMAPSAPPPAQTVALAAPPPARNPSEATLVAPAGQPPPQSSRHTTLWVALGLVVAAGVVAAVVLLNPSYPDASFGKAPGN